MADLSAVGGFSFGAEGGLACPCKQLAGVRRRRNPASTHLLLPSSSNPTFSKPWFLKHSISIYAYTYILSDATPPPIYSLTHLRILSVFSACPACPEQSRRVPSVAEEFLSAASYGGFSFGAEGRPIRFKPVSVSQFQKSPCQLVSIISKVKKCKKSVQKQFIFAHFWSISC
jgi:hypothetical protein